MREEKCAEHGQVEPSYKLRLSGILDDGSSSVRAVFFGESAENIIGFSTAEARKLFLNKGAAGLIKQAPLGEEFVVKGRISSNQVFQRNEMVANSVSRVDIGAEISMLQDK